MEDASADARPSRVQVVVRVRPVLPHEQVDDVSVTCAPDASKVQVLLPDRLAATQGAGGTTTAARSYEFDACLTGSTTQEDLFDVCNFQELVEAALDGYCVTIFAFGQTGSGKTHTMIGPRLSRGTEGAATTIIGSGNAAIAVDSEDGILARCLHHAFTAIDSRRGQMDYNVSASVVELYNETVADLLGCDRARTLAVRKDAQGGFGVDSLTQVPCPNAGIALKAMMRALSHRHTRAHKLNDHSSRSHCLMTFVFASKEVANSGGEAGEGASTGAGIGGGKGGIKRYGKLCLVDLAGSERLKETGNTAREAVRETGSINKSLFTLGQVLSALSARSTASSLSSAAFVPYRDSKLTQLLWDGLRGTGRCLMLACLGPLKNHSEETINTLHFASMARRIKAEPVVILDPLDQLVLDLRKIIQKLRQENQTLASALQHAATGNADPSRLLDALPESMRSGITAAMAATTAGTLTPPGSAPAANTGACKSWPAIPPGTAPSESGSGTTPARDAAGMGPAPWDAALHSPSLSMHGSSPNARHVQTGSSQVLRVGTSSASGSPSTAIGAGAAAAQALRNQTLGASPLGSGGWRGSSGPRSSSRGRLGASSINGSAAPSMGNASLSVAPNRPGDPSPSRRLGLTSLGQQQGYPSHNNHTLTSPGALSGGTSNGGAAGRSRSVGTDHRRTGGRGGRGGGTLSSSIGTGGLGALDRPSYLSEDPAALLFGYSPVMQGLPSQQQQGAAPGNGSLRFSQAQLAGMSGSNFLPSMPPTRGPPSSSSNSNSTQALLAMNTVAPPSPAFEAFPELAALEAEFQSLMGGSCGAGSGGMGSGQNGPMGRLGAGSSPGRGSGGSSRSGSRPDASVPGSSSSAGSSAGSSSTAPGGQTPQLLPEPRALKWAERNTWFGSDREMTHLAYQIHDDLVRQGIDPASDVYYDAIERTVADAFPDRWAQLTGSGGSNRRSQSQGRAAAAGSSPTRRSAAAGADSAGGGGSGCHASFMRVSLKDATPMGLRMGGPGRPSIPQFAASGTVFSNMTRGSVPAPAHGPSNAVTGEGGYSRTSAPSPVQTHGSGPIQRSNSVNSAMVPNSPQALQQHHQQQLVGTVDAPWDLAIPPYTPMTPGTPHHAPLTPESPIAHSGTSHMAASSGINPLNIQAMHARAPPKGAHSAAHNGGLNLVPVGNNFLGGGGSGYGGMGMGGGQQHVTAAQMQVDYMRQRQAVVEELRRAKEDAESERKRILARIGRTLAAGNWRR